jgi:hypothetical protein
MERMIAERSFEYAGTRVEPGEQFFAQSGHVPFLTKTRRASRYSPPTYQRRDMQAAAVRVDNIDDLRTRYETKFGKKPNKRWREARLRAELETII